MQEMQENQPRLGRLLIIAAAIALFVIGADQYSKWFVLETVLRAQGGGPGFLDWFSTPRALSYFAEQQGRYVTDTLAPFLNFVMVWNKGCQQRKPAVALRRAGVRDLGPASGMDDSHAPRYYHRCDGADRRRRDGEFHRPPALPGGRRFYRLPYRRQALAGLQRGGQLHRDRGRAADGGFTALAARKSSGGGQKRGMRKEVWT
jgi:hypothetical protein